MQTVLEWFYWLISVLPASFLFDLPWKQTWELAKKSKIFQNQQSQALRVPGDVKLTTGPIRKAENNAQKCQVKVEFPREMGRGRAVAAWAPIFPFFEPFFLCGDELDVFFFSIVPVYFFCKWAGRRGFYVNEVKLSWTRVLLAALPRFGLRYNFREKNNF